MSLGYLRWRMAFSGLVYCTCHLRRGRAAIFCEIIKYARMQLDRV